MKRETKIGLLIGVGLILLVSVIVCDYLAQVQEQVPADFTKLFTRDPQPADTPAAVAPRAYEPAPTYAQIPTPAELEQQRPAPSHTFTQPSNPVVVQRETPQTQTATRTESVAAPRAGQIVHYVKQGETLYSIAFRYYGNGEYWRSIAQANPNVDDAGRVSTGQRLVIPNDANWIEEANAALALREDDVPVVRTSNTATSQPTLSRVASRPREITVERGDTLSGLASKHLGSAGRWRELMEANKDRLSKPEELRAGMKLRLPNGNSASSSNNQATQANNTGNRNRTTSRPVLSRILGSGSSSSSAVSASEEAQIREGALAYARATENVATGRSYRVQSGDTLARIAQRELGNADRWREIYDANRSRLSDPNAVQVGQVLTLPAR